MCFSLYIYKYLCAAGLMSRLESVFFGDNLNDCGGIYMAHKGDCVRARGEPIEKRLYCSLSQ